MTTYDWSANNCFEEWTRRIYLKKRTTEPENSQQVLCEGDITLPLLKDAYRTAARVVAEHGEEYLPVFERLHNEIELRQAKEEMLSIALDIAVDKS